MLSRKLILALANLAPTKRLIKSPAAYRRLVLRFVAGDTLADAVRVIRILHEQGIATTLDYLGERVTRRELARTVLEEYKKALADGLPQIEGIDATISVKLSQLGMDVDASLCADHMREVLEWAREHGGRTVTIDMEDSAYVDRTLDLYDTLRDEGYDNIGAVLQSYLRRTPDDLDRLTMRGAEIRLCKGAYAEPPEIAFPRKRDVDRAFVDLARSMLTKPCRPAFATHDMRIVETVKAMAAEIGVPKTGYEFQMLYGIGREAQRAIVTDGYRMRVYVPYGTEWYAYFSRRIAERPANLGFVLRNILRR